MKILIIEDEPAAVRRLTKLIHEIDPTYEIVEDLDSIEATLNWVEDNQLPDLFLMDIHLADGSSFEIFNHTKILKPVIFTTAYDQYALDAFKVNAVDYLLKPIKKTELKRALEKYQNLQKSFEFDYRAFAQKANPDQYNKRFLIRFGQKIRVIEMRDAAYFYTQNKITFLITKKGKRYPIDYSLEKLEELADPPTFFRINRQFIINIESIETMQSYSKSRVKIDLNPPCELETVVSTERSPVFKKWLVGEV